jgi:hypothetical protein
MRAYLANYHFASQLSTLTPNYHFASQSWQPPLSTILPESFIGYLHSHFFMRAYLANYHFASQLSTLTPNYLKSLKLPKIVSSGNLHSQPFCLRASSITYKNQQIYIHINQAGLRPLCTAPSPASILPRRSYSSLTRIHISFSCLMFTSKSS